MARAKAPPARRQARPRARPYAPERDPKALPVLTINGKGLRANVASALTDATLEYSTAEAPTLTLALRDPAGRLAASDLIAKGCTCRTGPGEPVYELVRAEYQGRALTLTFEDQVAPILRRLEFPTLAAPVADRWGFVRRLLVAVRPRVQFVIAASLPPSSPSAQTGRSRKGPAGALDRPHSGPVGSTKADPIGLGTQGTASTTAKITVQGQDADATQREMITRVLRVCVERGVTTAVAEAAIATITVESWARNLKGGDRDSAGLFQQRPSQGWGTYSQVTNPEHATGSFLDRAVPAFKKDPRQSIGVLAQSVQRSAYPDRYQKWAKEARATVKAVAPTVVSGKGLADQGSTAGTAAGDPAAEQPETLWDALARIADEVKWRRILVRNVLYMVPDRQLLGAQAAYALERGRGGVLDVDWSLDTGQPLSEATVAVSSRRLGVVPGVVAVVAKTGPAAGPWLCSRVTRSLFKSSATIELRRPESELPPKALDPGGTTEASAGADAAGSDVRSRIVEAAKNPNILGRCPYGQVRPVPHKAKAGMKTDCSGWAICCYEVAGAPDPSGNNFNGSGSTVSIAAHGKDISKSALQPGDLIVYGSRSAGGNSAHVVVYLGGGKVSSQGGGMGPKIVDLASYRQDAVAYKSYVE